MEACNSQEYRDNVERAFGMNGKGLGPCSTRGYREDEEEEDEE